MVGLIVKASGIAKEAGQFHVFFLLFRNIFLRVFRGHFRGLFDESESIIFQPFLINFNFDFGVLAHNHP